MKSSNLSFVYFDKDELSKIVNEAISKALGNINPIKQETKVLGEFISQNEAMRLLGRKTTWFFNKRASGELIGKKTGNQWWYRKKDILTFIENGKES